MIDNKLNYGGRDRRGNPVNVLIEDKSGGVYALSTVKVVLVLYAQLKRSKRPTVQEQPIEPTVVDRQTISDNNLDIEQAEQLIQPTGFSEQPVESTVVDRQSMTFDNPMFDEVADDQLDALTAIDSELETAGEPPLESY